MKNTPFLILFGLSLLVSYGVYAQAPRVGKKAAEEYLSKGKEVVVQEVQSVTRGSWDNLLMLHLGAYTGSQAYQWNYSGRLDNVAKANYGVTYLFTDWHSFDLNLRGDFSEFDLNGVRAVKFSLLPMITFPRAEAGFPLYFGLGAGLGIFFQQVPDESNLALDYQLVVGTRFLDLWDGGGLFAEFGLKNHLHVLTDGQMNGSALSAGAVFTF